MLFPPLFFTMLHRVDFPRFERLVCRDDTRAVRWPATPDPGLRHLSGIERCAGRRPGLMLGLE